MFIIPMIVPFFFFFFFNDTATTEIYTLSLHDALPISTVTSSKATFAYLIGASEADHRDVAHGGDDLVRPVGDRGLADDERHGAALAGLLVEVHDLRPAEVRLARDELPEDLELLLAVEHARDVDAEIAEQRARVRALVAEGHGEGRRRYHVAPRGRRSDSIVQIERIQIPDGSREFFDLSPFYLDD